jgi:hypothetical protein
VCYERDVSEQRVSGRADRATEPFERAKLPMVIAAVGVVVGLAIAGSIEKTATGAGGAVVVGSWVLGIAALHRLGRAGSSRPVSPPSDSKTD